MKTKSLLLLLTMGLLLGCADDGHRAQQDIKNKIQKAELGTVQYTVRQIIRNSDETWKFFGSKKVLFSVKATLKAGIDLDKMTDRDVVARGKSVRVTLPKPEVLSLSILPDDIQLVYSKVSLMRSDYTQQEYDEILRAGEEAILADEALIASLLADAKQNARDFFELLLRDSGFTDIEILFDE